MKTRILSLMLYSLALLSLESCKVAPSFILDFTQRPPEGRNAVGTPRGQSQTVVGRFNNADGSVRNYTLDCKGTATIDITQLWGAIGVLTINSVNQNSCDMQVNIRGLHQDHQLHNPPRRIKPGTSTTEIFNIDGRDNITVEIKCLDGNIPCAFTYNFFTGPEVHEKLNVRDTTIAESIINREIPEVPGKNKCTSIDWDTLKTIQLSVGNWKFPVNISFSSVSKCECPFEVKATWDDNGKEKIAGVSKSTTNQRMGQRKPIRIPDHKTPHGSISYTFYGRCVSASPANPSCNGDVLVTLSPR